VLALVLLGAFLLAAALALLLEHIHAGFRSSDQVEDATGLKVLAVVPAVVRGGWLRQTPRLIARYVLKRPSSSFAEALNSLRIGLLTLDGREPPKSILFTSSYPGEGKTTLAIAFARLLARQGRKVILVDADVRRAHVDDAVELRPRAGLIELLAREAALPEVLAQDPLSPLTIIAAGRGKAKVQTIIDQAALSRLVTQLGQSYDFVVIDGAPILVVSDVRILARVVDATLFVVRWSETAQGDVRSALAQLADAGARVAGVVLNAVDIRRYAGYEYRNPRAYVRAYSRYYRS
jgi:capsular exopolysaccharide synthesis family protein